MPFCRECGKFVEEEDDFCPKCGAPQNRSHRYEGPSYSHSEDKGGIVWTVLGFFVPIAGLIIYLIWNKEKPNTAAMAGIGALLWLIVWVGVYILFILFGA